MAQIVAWRDDAALVQPAQQDEQKRSRFCRVNSVRCLRTKGYPPRSSSDSTHVKVCAQTLPLQLPLPLLLLSPDAGDDVALAAGRHSLTSMCMLPLSLPPWLAELQHLARLHCLLLERPYAATHAAPGGKLHAPVQCSPAVQLHDQLAAAVVVNKLELADVPCRRRNALLTPHAQRPVLS